MGWLPIAPQGQRPGKGYLRMGDDRLNSRVSLSRSLAVDRCYSWRCV